MLELACEEIVCWLAWDPATGCVGFRAWGCIMQRILRVMRCAEYI